MNELSPLLQPALPVAGPQSWVDCCCWAYLDSAAFIIATESLLQPITFKEQNKSAKIFFIYIYFASSYIKIF